MLLEDLKKIENEIGWGKIQNLDDDRGTEPDGSGMCVLK